MPMPMPTPRWTMRPSLPHRRHHFVGIADTIPCAPRIGTRCSGCDWLDVSFLGRHDLGRLLMFMPLPMHMLMPRPMPMPIPITSRAMRASSQHTGITYSESPMAYISCAPRIGEDLCSFCRSRRELCHDARRATVHSYGHVHRDAGRHAFGVWVPYVLN